MRQYGRTLLHYALTIKLDGASEVVKQLVATGQIDVNKRPVPLRLSSTFHRLFICVPRWLSVHSLLRC